VPPSDFTGNPISDQKHQKDQTMAIETSPLTASPVVGFIPISEPTQALAFYRDMLGLTLIEDQTPFALVFQSGTGPGSIMIRATFAAGFKPQPFTIFGWQVTDIESTVQTLTDLGVVFTRYARMNDAHPLGIWSAPGGTKVAWFQDPFGNVLSLQQGT
jgi:predicted enzyme related to lactoylglutathione lyase